MFPALFGWCESLKSHTFRVLSSRKMTGAENGEACTPCSHGSERSGKVWDDGNNTHRDVPRDNPFELSSLTRLAPTTFIRQQALCRHDYHNHIITGPVRRHAPPHPAPRTERRHIPSRVARFVLLILKVIGTHNSYHRHTSIPVIGDMFSYDFQSIVEQLDAGVRHLELDVHYDWKTGRFVCLWRTEWPYHVWYALRTDAVPCFNVKPVASRSCMMISSAHETATYFYCVCSGNREYLLCKRAGAAKNPYDLAIYRHREILTLLVVQYLSVVPRGLVAPRGVVRVRYPLFDQGQVPFRHKQARPPPFCFASAGRFG